MVFFSTRSVGSGAAMIHSDVPQITKVGGRRVDSASPR